MTQAHAQAPTAWEEAIKPEKKIEVVEEPLKTGSQNVESKTDPAEVSPLRQSASARGGRRTTAETGLSQASLAKKPKTSPIRAKVKRCCYCIAENKVFVAVSTLITIWALAGDDLKLLTTNKPMDSVFDGLVIFCLAFFSIEVVIGCLGKDDYFMGFFFILDVVSTATLLMDLSVVAEALFGNNDTDPSKARSSRTARVGARVGRVVRVLRLIRIVKLFKVCFTTSKQNEDKKKKKNVLDDDFEEYLPDEEEQDSGDKESLVGKKLSAKMTQSTVILILTLLISLPLLRVDQSERLPTSGYYAADDVLESYRSAEMNPSARPLYEDAVLRMLYYHNWFLGGGRANECPRDAGCAFYFMTHAFWVGVGGSTDPQLRALNASLSAASVEAFNAAAAQQNDLFNFGTMPPEVVKTLSQPWETECKTGGGAIWGMSVLKETVPGFVDFAAPCPTDLRFNEVERIQPRLLTPDQFSEWYFVFFFDMRPFVRTEAANSLMTTVFICIVLCIASLGFASAANVLVLQPVEKMIQKVEAIRQDPLVAMKMADDEYQREEQAKKLKAKQAQKRCKDPRNLCKQQASEPMETVILEKTIIKLGSLLALGFGEAGANIVSSNMSGSNSGVNAMVKGSRVDCIIGIARILNFSTATEVLQGKVMTFVNQIAEIVHGVVDQCRGAVNKNDGDTFVIVWITAGLNEEEVSRTAELSIVAFSMVVGGISRSPVLAAYQSHPALQQRLRENCRVELSFGLHNGWAIEGAVGSEFKIDASYISPNVSIATNIERATRVYGVPFLISESVVDLASRGMARRLRLIDKVNVKGSLVPLELYCLDLDFTRVPADDRPRLPINWNSHYRFKSRHCIEKEKERLWNEEPCLVEFMEKDYEFKLMRKLYTEEFFQTFKMGYQNYFEGEWQVARNLLMKTHTMLKGKKDGPSGALLRFMESPHNFKAPVDWRGVHPLRES
eukprot:TRINITY_DN8313_c0_g1_i1.p1 TRINITY_DN8313_c0_g1~~TRINITY_DN8313_c0_g1_i1.p1  ORF type:complete len:956 (+),score=196.21 TRINITY_DN8313_c0_g1_i1:247-3114(+)